MPAHNLFFKIPKPRSTKILEFILMYLVVNSDLTRTYLAAKLHLNLCEAFHILYPLSVNIDALHSDVFPYRTLTQAQKGYYVYTVCALYYFYQIGKVQNSENLSFTGIQLSDGETVFSFYHLILVFLIAINLLFRLEVLRQQFILFFLL